MNKQNQQIYNELKKSGLTPEQDEIIRLELEMEPGHKNLNRDEFPTPLGVYDYADLSFMQDFKLSEVPVSKLMKTLDELLEKDNQREKDGFPKRIRMGKYVKPGKGKKDQIIVVPMTTEPKFYHDNSVTQDEEEQTGGAGDGEEGEVIGEQQAEPQEGEGSGAGQGKGGEHDVTSNAFDLGKILTEKFKLPNLKDKGKKRAFSKYTYELNDRNRGFGQVLDKKETLKRIVKTNILLGNVSQADEVNTENLLINPKDHIYQILSKEKDFETQAVVFFLRDYSGSMQGKPTEIISAQHLFIYSWLVYQYQNNVLSRFIVHDNDAKEVPDFHAYYNSQIAGGTNIFPAFELVNKIIEEEQLARDYNIYVFHGTDGDDWDSDGKKAIEELKKMMKYTNRIGITVARNSWGGANATTVENYLESSGILKDRKEMIRMDSMNADQADEERIIKGIRTLTEE
ncbi:DUF444 family protein [Bacteroidota bacterium]